MAKQQVSFPYAFFQDKLVPIEKAKISIMTNALQYGTAVFGGIRVYQTFDKKAVSIFRLEGHYRRLISACKILNIPPPYPAAKMAKLTIELVKKNKPRTDSYIRPIIYASSYHLSPNLNPKVAEYSFSAYMIPLGEYLDIAKGLDVCVSSWTRISDNMVPARGKISGGYINSALARYEAELNGFDEAIVLDKDNHVSEGSGENLFIVRDGALITPPVFSDILEGITRLSVIELAGDLGIKVVERDIDRTELYIADEAFFSGTGVQVAWIKSIDHRTIGKGRIGPFAQKIQQLFFDVVRGKSQKYVKWRTVIPI